MILWRKDLAEPIARTTLRKRSESVTRNSSGTESIMENKKRLLCTGITATLDLFRALQQLENDLKDIGASEISIMCCILQLIRVCKKMHRQNVLFLLISNETETCKDMNEQRYHNTAQEPNFVLCTFLKFQSNPRPNSTKLIRFLALFVSGALSLPKRRKFFTCSRNWGFTD